MLSVDAAVASFYIYPEPHSTPPGKIYVNNLPFRPPPPCTLNQY
jgi:hypothetical protein